MRAATFELEQRRIVDLGLINFPGVLSDQMSDHLEMAEFFHGDILQHVAQAGVFDMKGLHPVLQRGGEFARGAAELFEQESSKLRVRFAHVNRPEKFFAMVKHVMSWSCI